MMGIEPCRIHQELCVVQNGQPREGPISGTAQIQRKQKSYDYIRNVSIFELIRAKLIREI